jgi:hypothetical protein
VVAVELVRIEAGGESTGATTGTRVDVAARTKAVDGLPVEMAPTAREFAAPELACGAANAEVGDDLVAAAAEAPAWSCGRDELGFVDTIVWSRLGMRKPARSGASAMYSAHFRSESRGLAARKSLNAFILGLSSTMA